MPCSTNFQEYEVASNQSVAYAGCMDVITEEIKMILEVVTTSAIPCHAILEYMRSESIGVL